MKDEIVSKYDDEIEAYSVSFPEHVSYEALNKWNFEFQKILYSREYQKPVALLLDSNKHDFESIECLKFLREILTKFANMKNGIYKIAFVQPANYRKPEVVDLNDEKWVSDITDIKLDRGFVYLSIIMDLFSRQIIGWSLDATMTTDLIVEAFELAKARRNVTHGLILHSDRGVQYRSAQYQGRLHAQGIRPSMSGLLWEVCII